MHETGYGSDEFLRASRLAAACRAIEGTGAKAAWRRARAGSVTLARYHYRLPVTELHLTTTPAGRMIGEHFSIRDDEDRFRFRAAQGILALPDDFADYMRGRHRQALRTNIGHARRLGYVIHSYAVDNWLPGVGDLRRAAITPGPIERWLLTGPDGYAADSILSVDREVALLHGLVSYALYARWLLHAAIIERLCGQCRVLLTNSADAYFIPPGNQHFQRLLGFRISRLEISRSPLPAPAAPPDPTGLSWPAEEPATCGIARQPTLSVPGPGPEPDLEPPGPILASA